MHKRADLLVLAVSTVLVTLAHSAPLPTAVAQPWFGVEESVIVVGSRSLAVQSGTPPAEQPVMRAPPWFVVEQSAIVAGLRSVAVVWFEDASELSSAGLRVGPLDIGDAGWRLDPPGADR